MESVAIAKTENNGVALRSFDNLTELKKLPEEVALQELNKHFFMGNADYPIKLEADEAGVAVTIDGEKKPLLDTIFPLKMLQNAGLGTDPGMQNKAGYFKLTWNDNNFDLYETIDVLPICICGQQFKKFPEDYKPNGSSGILCYSRNGLVPYVGKKNSLPPVSRRCAHLAIKNGVHSLSPECSDAKWPEGGGAPACTQYIRIGLLDLEHLIPLVFEVHKTGVGAFNKFCKARKLIVSAARVKGNSIPRFIVRLGSTKARNYVMPDFSMIEAPEKYKDLSAYWGVAQYYRDNLFFSAQNGGTYIWGNDSNVEDDDESDNIQDVPEEMKSAPHDSDASEFDLQ